MVIEWQYYTSLSTSGRIKVEEFILPQLRWVSSIEQAPYSTSVSVKRRTCIQWALRLRDNENVSLYIIEQTLLPAVSPVFDPYMWHNRHPHTSHSLD